MSSTFQTQVVSISGRDAKVSLDGLPLVSVSGSIIWDGDPSRDIVMLNLRPLHHAALPEETLNAKAGVPGPFTFERLAADEYELQLVGIPFGAYLKDVISAGRSLLHRPLPVADLGDLRVILARDGARITTQGDADAWMVAVPSGAGTEIDVADSMVWGRAGADGKWTAPLLAPGKYLVLASPTPVDRSVEAVARVFQARGKAKECDLAPGTTRVVTLK
jgi:hypothetical protein